jgi:hypothetical protein
MAPLPIEIIAGEFGSALAFGVVIGLVKVPAFARLRIS